MYNEEDDDISGGWDEDPEEANQDIIPFTLHSNTDIESKIPEHIEKAKELLHFDNEDNVISVLRYFKWDNFKLE